jgi:hypothetical protein
MTSSAARPSTVTDTATAETAEQPAAPPSGTAGRQTIDVRLRLWGFTNRDVDGAAQNVTYHPDYDRWDIEGTEQTVARCTTIRPNDPTALAQRAGHGWAWAVYPGGERRG